MIPHKDILPNYFILTIACITVLAPFSIDAYLPALVNISLELETSENLAQLTIAIFLLGFSLGPLIFGPLSDSLGRRKLIIISLIMFCIFSFLCSLSSNIYLLILFRFFQAVSGSVSTVCGRAAVADLFTGNELVKKLSLIGLMLNIAPLLAPIIGGWINLLYGWRVIFLFIGIFGLLFVLLSFFMVPETLEPKKRVHFKISQIFKIYLNILKNKSALAHIIFLAASSSVFFAYLSITPFLYINKFNMSPILYSYIFALGAVIAMLSNVLVMNISSIVGYKNIIKWVCILSILNALILFFGGIEILGRWSIYFSGLMFMGLFHVANVTSLTGILDEFKKGKGAATALATSLRFAFGMLGAVIVSISNNETIFPYIIVVLIFSIISSLAGFLAVFYSQKPLVLV